MSSTDKKYIRIWYWSGAILVFLILVIGGITRLTGSGLSMTDWKPIMGMLPPLTETQWENVFEQYKQFPEYRQVNRGMSLEAFKFIYFWEYVHRMAARILGLIFIVPFGWFLYSKKLDRTQIKRALILLGLGITQGVLGWYMVQSGLVDIPSVSPYRLAVHLGLAFAIFGCCIWFALDLRPPFSRERAKTRRLRWWVQVFIFLLILQILWGALVAGHHAGHIYNTFPTMNQYWVPPELWIMEPLWVNITENMVTVQWIHRVIGTLLVVLVIGVWTESFRRKTGIDTKKRALALLAIVLAQYVTGVFTLIYHVPVWLGVAHQAMAMIVFGIALGFLHHLKKPEKEKTAEQVR